MPALATTVTATTRTEVKLKPSVKAKLLKSLRAYAALHDQKKTLEHAMEGLKGTIGELREETGEQSIALDGFKITQIAGTRNVFNKKKFISLGGDLDLYNEAHDTVPSKPYEKITLPSADADEEYD